MSVILLGGFALLSNTLWRGLTEAVVRLSEMKAYIPLRYLLAVQINCRRAG